MAVTAEDVLTKVHDCHADCGCSALERLGRYMVSVGFEAVASTPEVLAKAEHWSYWLAAAIGMDPAVLSRYA